MGEHDIAFPMDVTDPSRPWKFKPRGYLVVILTGISEARRALSALVEGGFRHRDIKVYSGEQILENDVVNRRRRTVARRLLGPVTDEDELAGRELYLGYAREGRSALWLRLPNEEEVSKALRVLADYDYLHARYYGFTTEDFVRRHRFHEREVDARPATGSGWTSAPQRVPERPVQWRRQSAPPGAQVCSMKTP
jgi:hypothetical protein